jgi:hypothetical protein
MFVRLLAVLISDVLCYFSVLVCCRSLVRIVVQRGGIKQSGSLAPVSAIDRTKCDRAHCVQTQKPRSNASHVSCEVHVALAAITNSLAPWEFRVIICNRSHTMRSNAMRSNSNTYDRTHTAL